MELEGRPIDQKPRDLTYKQRRFVDEFIKNNGNATLAAKAAGYKYPHARGPENVEKSTIKSAIQAVMDKKGITWGRIADKLSEGLDAKKVVSAIITGKDADSRTDDFIEVPDYATQHKFMDSAIKIREKLDGLEKKDEEAAKSLTEMIVIRSLEQGPSGETKAQEIEISREVKTENTVNLEDL